MNYWKNIRPGKYEIEKGSSLLSIIRKLRNGQQTPVDLVVTRLRTRNDLARLIGRKLEMDSAEVMKYIDTSSWIKEKGLTPQQALTIVLPDTYRYFWNASPDRIFQKFREAHEKFWTAERKARADSLGLSPVQVHTLASIVEEETNADAEKGNIASVYLNRMKKGMPLQADPTVKFALNDFTLRRIYHKHLETESPYNTYRVKGLPPGPISTPSRKTIDAVLNAPETGYLYFVASPQFNGTHEFSSTYAEHLQKAKQYQAALDQRNIGQ
jgi:UPF0755 protein